MGRLHKAKEAKDCHYAERVLVDNAAQWPIDSDILIGQHHGGNNASTSCFIRAVSPRYVVFSAGSKGYGHPNANVAARYLAAGLKAEDMFRTDRGDAEGHGEWIRLSIAGCDDKPGDDDVEFWIPSDGSPIRAGYLVDKKTC